MIKTRFLINLEILSEKDFLLKKVESLDSQTTIFLGSVAFKFSESREYPKELYSFISRLSGKNLDRIVLHINE